MPLLGLLACPGCGSAPLELDVFEHGDEVAVEDAAGVETGVLTGLLSCEPCGRFYAIRDGIPRMVDEEFANLVDRTFLAERADRLGERADALRAYLDRVAAGSASSKTPAWELEEGTF